MSRFYLKKLYDKKIILKLFHSSPIIRFFIENHVMRHELPT